jgi:hypothetical protein
MHTSIHMHACLDVCVCKPIHAFACAHPSICTHCVHMCVFTHTHMCIHTHTQTCIQDTKPKLAESKTEGGETESNHDTIVYSYIFTHIAICKAV